MEPKYQLEIHWTWLNFFGLLIAVLSVVAAIGWAIYHQVMFPPY